MKKLCAVSSLIALMYMPSFGFAEECQDTVRRGFFPGVKIKIETCVDAVFRNYVAANDADDDNSRDYTIASLKATCERTRSRQGIFTKRWRVLSEDSFTFRVGVDRSSEWADDDESALEKVMMEAAASACHDGDDDYSDELDGLVLKFSGTDNWDPINIDDLEDVLEEMAEAENAQ